jgi:O-antigen/teichoic acid export membrane protein
MTRAGSPWLGNSLANVISGGSAAVFNLAMPALLARHLTRSEFSAWGLSLQIVAYVGLLGIGLQTAVAKHIAHAEECQSRGSSLATIRAASNISRSCMVLGLVLSLAVAVSCEWLFPTIPQDVLGEARWTLAMIGTAAALQLLSLVPMGIFQGLHTNTRFAVAQVAVRIAGVVLVGIGAQLDLGMPALAALLATSMAALTPLMWMSVHRYQPGMMAFSPLALDIAKRRRLLDDCLTLTVWGISMLIVNTAGMMVVARVAFEQTGAYSIAVTAATVLSGLIGAVMSPLLTHSVAVYAIPGRRTLLEPLLVRTTLLCGLGLAAIFLLLVLIHRPLLSAWVGADLASDSALPLLTLVGAHALRNVVAPYALMLVATGLNRRALWSGVAEGLCNLAATLYLGQRFGVFGVALGTLVGAVVGVIGTLLFNVPRTPELTPRPWRFALAVALPPLAAAVLIFIISLRA